MKSCAPRQHRKRTRKASSAPKRRKGPGRPRAKPAHCGGSTGRVARHSRAVRRSNATRSGSRASRSASRVTARTYNRARVCRR